MRRTIGFAVRPVAAVAVLAAATVAVGVAAPTAHAAASFVHVPTRLYMIPKEHSMVIPDLLAGLVIPIETMTFADAPLGDVISAQSREIKISADDQASCNVAAGATLETSPPFSITGCTAVQLDVSHGTLDFFPAPAAEDDPRFPTSSPRVQMYRFPGKEVLLRDADEDGDLKGAALALVGKASDMNDVLKTLRYTPTVDNGDDTDGVDEDYYYDGDNPERLRVSIIAGNGDPAGGVTSEVDIKVLDYNDFPEVTVGQEHWTTGNTGADLPLFSATPAPPAAPSLATFTVADEDNDEKIDQAQDDGDPDDGDLHDGDDPKDGEGEEFLVAMWTTCGKISLISSNDWGIIDDVEHVIDYVWDAAKDPNADDSLKDQFVSALEAVLPDEVENFPFATTNPTNPNGGFIGVANDIEALNYSLGRVTFHPVDASNNPLSDTTCKVRTFVTDLGNNGLPLHYFGDPPTGIVVPMFGVDFDTNYVPAVEQITIEVGDGDPPGQGGNAPTVVSVSDVDLAEGDSVTTPFTFTLTLDQPASGDESVMVAAQHAGGAGTTDDTDLTPIAPQPVTFAAGATTATFTVPVNGDTTVEPDEHFLVTLSSPQDVNVADSSGLGTVLNDDGAGAPVKVTQFSDVTMAEGNAGTTNFVFTIGLDKPAPAGGVVVRVRTDHVTTDDADLTPLGLQAVTFAPGQSSRTVTVQVKGDIAVEPTETFTATLSNPQGAVITAAAQSATGTITNDDYRHLTSISDATQAEGNAGTTNFTFTLTLDGPAVGGESVNVSTGGGTATAGTDYTSLVNVPVSFAVGATTATVTVSVVGDLVVEPTETFLLVPTVPTNLLIDDPFATGTILNDDSSTIVSVSGPSLTEGNAGTKNFPFVLTLAAPALGNESVVVDTAHVDTDDGDLTPLSSQVVTFVASATTATVNVSVTGDTVPEPDETFTLDLSSPTNLDIAPGAESATGTILNDDRTIVSIDDVTMAEGNGPGTTPFTFTITLDGPAVGNTTKVTAFNTHGTSDDDDMALVEVDVPFPEGATTATATFPVKGDTVPEPDETFTVGLKNPVNVTIDPAIGVGNGVIQDDDDPDAPPTVTIAGVAMAEGTGGTTDFVFTLSLDKPAVGTETVAVATNHVTTDGADLTVAPSPVTFAPGAMSATVVVVVGADSDPEPDETFTLTLSNPVGLLIIDGSATGTILNDDQPGNPLTIQDLPDITVPNDPGQAGAIVTFPLPTTQGGAAPVTVECSPASGSFFSLGATTVTCTATDSAQEQMQISQLATAVDTFVVTVVDNEPPVIADNPDLTRVTSGPPVTVTWNLPNASDNSSVPPTVVCSPVSGTSFAIGTATVTCTATDGAGNSASSSFTVTVVLQADQLPATGNDLRTPLLLAAATTLAGALLLLQRRRTRSIR